MAVNAEEISLATNHFLFIDDLKLLATYNIVMAGMVKETETFLNAIGLEVKYEKSVTSESSSKDSATLLNTTGVYKYLGIIKDNGSNIIRDSFEKVRYELFAKVNKLCKTNLKSKNLFKAINEHAISLVNYHIGLQHLEPADFLKLDHDIRQAIVKHKIHRHGCKERLYLLRTEMGRGLHCIEMKSEYMLLQLWETLNKYKNINSRRTAILKV